MTTGMTAEAIPVDATHRSFITTFVIQGVGVLNIAGRFSHLYSSAIKVKQPFLRIDDGDSVLIIPTPLILMCREGPPQGAVGPEANLPQQPDETPPSETVESEPPEQLGLSPQGVL